MAQRTNGRIRFVVALVFGSVVLGGAVAKAQVEAATAELEIARDAIALREMIRPRPIDRDRVDTALVFTNSGSGAGVVHCVGFDGNGNIVGRARVKLPRRGLRFALASDLANGRDFVGSAKCWTPGHVIGSAFLLGAGATDLPVKQRHIDGLVRVRFPVVATY